MLVGGERHLAKVPAGKADRLTWKNGFRETLDHIATLRGKGVVILASGDPMFYGVGSTLSRRFDAADFTVIPAPSAFSLAAARMGWPLADVETFTIHGRPLETLNLYLAPGARLLALSQDGATPARAARLMTERGFGPSILTVLEHMGGPKENHRQGTTQAWPCERTADLNVMAIECRAGPGAKVWSRAPGLPEDAFEHDGQITKRHVRAATLAALAPVAGQVLWDVGAGSGSVAIEWMRLGPAMRAVAMERDKGRAAAMARNAANLGVPGLKIMEGGAPEIFADTPLVPDAVFVGGGVSTPGLLEACWEALRPGGRLVANAVTVQAEARLLDFHQARGGSLTRIGVSHAQPVGALTAFKPLMQVTQYAGIKKKQSDVSFQRSETPSDESR